MPITQEIIDAPVTLAQGTVENLIAGTADAIFLYALCALVALIIVIQFAINIFRKFIK